MYWPSFVEDVMSAGREKTPGTGSESAQFIYVTGDKKQFSEPGDSGAFVYLVNDAGELDGVIGTITGVGTFRGATCTLVAPFAETMQEWGVDVLEPAS